MKGLIVVCNISPHLKEDLLIHGDSVYDIIDKQDHAAIQSELHRNTAATNCSSLNPGQTYFATFWIYFLFSEF